MRAIKIIFAAMALSVILGGCGGSSSGGGSTGTNSPPPPVTVLSITSPDKTKTASIIVPASTYAGIKISNADGSKSQQIWFGDQNIYSVSMGSWAADNKSFTFMVNAITASSGTSETVTFSINTDGSGLKQLTGDPVRDTGTIAGTPL